MKPFTLAIALSLITGCTYAKKPQEQILGTWRETQANPNGQVEEHRFEKEIVHFGGTGYLTIPIQYHWTSENTYKIKNPFGEEHYTKVSFPSTDELELTENGKTKRYKRVK
jgi:hypothetical protein